ncbi:MAG: hypothetical protein L3J88_03965 [Gammaproteobacteria bacterium]|nr:hypothetical protein [Gammaproteobacteria bacterium]MCF6362504.1 hypothetical protein [Gammaproteobacteria bacterium]
MEFAILYTLGAVAAYFFADWALNRFEAAYGKPIPYRHFLFFIILFGLAFIMMSIINTPEQ